MKRREMLKGLKGRGCLGADLCKENHVHSPCQAYLGIKGGQAFILMPPGEGRESDTSFPYYLSGTSGKCPSL